MNVTLETNSGQAPGLHRACQTISTSLFGAGSLADIARAAKDKKYEKLTITMIGKDLCA